MDLYTLVGYKFFKTNVAYSELPPDLVIIHVGYKLAEPNSLIVFNQISQARTKLLTEEDVKDYYKVVPKKLESKNRYEVKGKPPYTIVLCYDDGETLSDCTYSLGEVIDNIDKKTIIPKRDDKYEIITPKIEKSDLSELKDMFLEIPSIISSSKTRNELIENLKKYLEPNEEEYLTAYLSLAPKDELELIKYVKDYFYMDFEINVGEFN
jgi:hypothetical protein